MFPSFLLQRLAQARVVAGFAVERPDDAALLAKALLEGGVMAIELTLRTVAGIEAVGIISETAPELLLGVGTVLKPEQAILVKQRGADFGVSPGLNPRVLAAAREIGLPFAPGISTPTELESAIEQGCHFVKFFPAEALGGIPYLRSLSAPYDHLGVSFFPLGGLNAVNMMDYLAEPNVVAIGGSWIVKQDLVNRRAWQEITDRAAEVMQIMQNPRKGVLSS